MIKELEKLAAKLDQQKQFKNADRVDELIYKAAHYIPDYSWLDMKGNDYSIGWTTMMDEYRSGETSGAREGAEKAARVDTKGDKYDLSQYRTPYPPWKND